MYVHFILDNRLNRHVKKLLEEVMDRNSEETLSKEESDGMLTILDGLLKTGLIPLLNIHCVDVDENTLNGTVLSGILKGILIWQKVI